MQRRTPAGGWHKGDSLITVDIECFVGTLAHESDLESWICVSVIGIDLELYVSHQAIVA